LCLVWDADPPLVASTGGLAVGCRACLRSPLALPPLPACAAAARRGGWRVRTLDRCGYAYDL
jgi:hypothetical protein